MGSLEEASVTGFMCRLCSNISKHIIHVYGAEQLGLIKKIAVTVEITISPYDHLPKTICPKCLAEVERNYNFIKMVRRNFGMTRKRQRLMQPPPKRPRTS